MGISRRLATASTEKILLAVLGVSLVGQVTVAPCFSLGLPFTSSSNGKNSELKIPVYEKLDAGSTPDTNNPSLTSTPGQTTEPAAPPDLSPVNLSDTSSSSNTTSSTNTANTASTPAQDTADPNVLKSTVTQNSFVPKGPVDADSAALAPTSVVAPPAGKKAKSVAQKILKGESILEEAKKVNVMPLPLLPSEDEQKKKDEVKMTAEQRELADLWDATLSRSQDIQFVVQKLMPTKDPSHAQGVMMKMLSTAMFGGVGAAMMMAPNMGSQMGMNAGASMMYQAMNGVQNGQAKKAKLGETEAIMLYNIVRTTADKLVEHFRAYKTNADTLAKAGTDLEDLQNMAKEARSQDPSKQLEIDYTIKKAQRDVDVLQDKVRFARQNLTDLAGVDAVAKLDNQMVVDRQNLDAQTQIATPPPEEATPAKPAEQTATQPTPASGKTTPSSQTLIATPASGQTTPTKNKKSRKNQIASPSTTTQ